MIRPTRREQGILVIYLLMVVSGVLHHEPWRDEVRALVISVHADSMAGLFHLLRHEGHPALWYLFLKPFTLLPGGPALKLAGLLSGVAGALTLFLGLPLPLWIRTGALFSYYWIYEYVIVSRSYGLAFAFSSAALALWLRRRSLIGTALLLGLAANTHILLALISLPLIATIALTEIPAAKTRQRLMALLLAGMLLLGSYGAAAATVLQPQPRQFLIRRLGWMSGRSTVKRPGKLKAGVKAPAIGAAKAPRAHAEKRRRPKAALATRMRFWLRGVRVEAFERRKLATALLMLSMTLITPRVLLVYSLPALALAYGFGAKVYGMAIWHQGVMPMILIYSLALAASQHRQHRVGDWPDASWLGTLGSSRGNNRIGGISLSLLMLFGVVEGVTQWKRDHQQAFSGGTAAAMFLQSRRIQMSDLLIAEPAYAESAIALTHKLQAMRIDPDQPPILLPWPEQAVSQRPGVESPRIRSFCKRASALANRRQRTVAVIRWPGNENPKRCPGTEIHVFHGLRESVAIELITPRALNDRSNQSKAMSKGFDRPGLR